MDWTFTWENVLTVILMLVSVGLFLWKGGSWKAQIGGELSAMRDTMKSLNDRCDHIDSKLAGLSDAHNDAKNWQARTDQRLEAHDKRLAQNDEARRQIYQKMDDGFSRIEQRITEAQADQHSSASAQAQTVGEIKGRLEAMAAAAG